MKFSPAAALSLLFHSVIAFSAPGEAEVINSALKRLNAVNSASNKSCELITPGPKSDLPNFEKKKSDAIKIDGIDWGSDLCATQKIYLERQIRSRKSIEQLGSIVGEKNPSVIFLGEEHKEATPEYYQHLFPVLKKTMTNLDCVAFETSEAMVKLTGSLRPAWKKLASVAERSFASIHYVDFYLDQQEEKDEVASLAGITGGLNERSRRMSGHLAELLKSKKCHHILMINGTAHLMKNPSDQHPGIPERLNRMGISTFNLLMMDLSIDDSRRRRNSRDTWLWPKGPSESNDWLDPSVWDNRCADVPGRIGENYAILNADEPLAKKIPVAYINDKVRGTAGPMSQFDAILMLQCPSLPGTTCK